MKITKTEAAERLNRSRAHLSTIQQGLALPAGAHAAIKQALRELNKVSQIMSTDNPRPITERVSK